MSLTYSGMPVQLWLRAFFSVAAGYPQLAGLEIGCYSENCPDGSFICYSLAAWIVAVNRGLFIQARFLIFLRLLSSLQSALGMATIVHEFWCGSDKPLGWG